MIIFLGEKKRHLYDVDVEDYQEPYLKGRVWGITNHLYLDICKNFIHEASYSSSV